MNLARFVDERQPDWIELDRLVERAGARLESLPKADVLQVGRLYRAAAADLAIARRRFAADPVVGRLDRLVRQAHQLVYANAAHRESFADFVRRRYWQRVAERPMVLLVAALLLWVPMIGTGLWAHGDPVTANRVAAVSPLTSAGGDDPPDDDADRGFSNVESASLSTQIFTNNVRVALVAFAGGVTGGLLTAYVLVFNGFTVGLLAGLITEAGGGERFYRLVVPHGLLELSLITVAGMAGLRVGLALVRPGHRRRGDALVTEARAAGELALGTALWLIPCGLIEGFVTPRGLSLPAAVALGVALAVLYWTLVVWLGRPTGSGADRRPSSWAP